jgi:pilus assembly protein CpaC
LLAGCGLALPTTRLVAQQQWAPVPPAPAAVVAEAPPRPHANHPLPEQISAMPSVSENLDIVQHHSQLLVARTNVVRTAVADPSIVDIVQYSPSELSIIGLELGSTTLTLWFDNSHQPLIYQVNTIRDPNVEERRRLDFSKLERKLAILFPNSKVYLIPFSGKLVVKGQAHDTEEAAKILQIIRGEVAVTPPVSAEFVEKQTLNQPQQANRRHVTIKADESAAPVATDIVNLLEVPGEFQVMLRVRIAELNRSLLRSMGVNLNNVLFDRRHTVQQIRNTRRQSLAGIFENGEIDAAIHALISNNTATILSEPVLTVISGHSASFLSGGEFAVPTIVGVEGVGAQQTTFHGFGTSLVVTPQVLDHDLIRMKISPEFSQLDSANTVNGIPGVDTRRAETTVQLREGQTIVLAGLISRQNNTSVARTGWSDMPVVGPLFSGRRSLQEETELLILVTPEIVRPMDAEEVPPVPGHEVTAPNNCEFFKCGKTEGCPDPNVYQSAPYGTGQNAGVPVGFQLFNSHSTTPTVPAQVMPTPAAPTAPPAPGASTQYRPYQPTQTPTAQAPASGTLQSLGNAQTTNYGAPTDGPIVQTAATFSVSDSPQTDSSDPRSKWYQHPFRSFGWSQSTPQRPADGATAPSSAAAAPASGANGTDATQPQQVQP